MNIYIVSNGVEYISKSQVDFGGLFERLQQADRRTAELTAELSSVLSKLHNVTGITNINCTGAFGKED